MNSHLTVNDSDAGKLLPKMNIVKSKNANKKMITTTEIDANVVKFKQAHGPKSTVIVYQERLADGTEKIKF